MDNKTTITLTKKERQLILFALKIACEDESIYPTRMTPGAEEKVRKQTDAMIEAIEAKLK